MVNFYTLDHFFATEQSILQVFFSRTPFDRPILGILVCQHFRSDKTNKSCCMRLSTKMPFLCRPGIAPDNKLTNGQTPLQGGNRRSIRIAVGIFQQVVTVYPFRNLQGYSIHFWKELHGKKDANSHEFAFFLFFQPFFY